MDATVIGICQISVKNLLGFYLPGPFLFILAFTATLATPLQVGKQSRDTKSDHSITLVRAEWVAVDQEELTGFAGA